MFSSSKSVFMYVTYWIFYFKVWYPKLVSREITLSALLTEIKRSKHKLQTKPICLVSSTASENTTK